MISIVIPTYNCSSYIGEAIESVLAQTLCEHEIIVVDDGSNDATEEIVKRRYPMVRYVRKEQGGVSSARNLGIATACGQYIAFLDADDIWEPGKLKKQIDLFKQRPELGMVFAENSTFDRNNNIVDKGFNKRNRLLKGDVVKNIFLRSYVTTSTVVVKQGVFDAVGVFEELLHAGEDDNMWMRIAMKYPIDLIDEPLVRYRITAGSLSRTHQNLMSGVKKHIELIQTKYLDLYDRLGQAAIKQKYFVVHFDEAYHCFDLKLYQEARTFFRKSMQYKPSDIRSYVYYLSCCFPPSFIQKIKLWKQRLNAKETAR